MEKTTPSGSPLTPVKQRTQEDVSMLHCSVSSPCARGS